MNEEIKQQNSTNGQNEDQDYERIVPLEKQEKLEELKKIALEKGLTKAVFIAKKMDDPFLLDELHDALADELKSHFISKGELEQL